jgi:hypothetical protein
VTTDDKSAHASSVFPKRRLTVFTGLSGSAARYEGAGDPRPFLGVASLAQFARRFDRVDLELKRSRPYSSPEKLAEEETRRAERGAARHVLAPRGAAARWRSARRRRAHERRAPPHSEHGHLYG